MLTANWKHADLISNKESTSQLKMHSNIHPVQTMCTFYFYTFTFGFSEAPDNSCSLQVFAVSNVNFTG